MSVTGLPRSHQDPLMRQVLRTMHLFHEKKALPHLHIMVPALQKHLGLKGGLDCTTQEKEALRNFVGSLSPDMSDEAWASAKNVFCAAFTQLGIPQKESAELTRAVASISLNPPMPAELNLLVDMIEKLMIKISETPGDMTQTYLIDFAAAFKERLNSYITTCLSQNNPPTAQQSRASPFLSALQLFYERELKNCLVEEFSPDAKLIVPQTCRLLTNDQERKKLIDAINVLPLIQHFLVTIKHNLISRRTDELLWNSLIKGLHTSCIAFGFNDQSSDERVSNSNNTYDGLDPCLTDLCKEVDAAGSRISNLMHTIRNTPDQVTPQFLLEFQKEFYTHLGTYRKREGEFYATVPKDASTSALSLPEHQGHMLLKLLNILPCIQKSSQRVYKRIERDALRRIKWINQLQQRFVPSCANYGFKAPSCDEKPPTARKNQGDVYTYFAELSAKIKAAMDLTSRLMYNIRKHEDKATPQQLLEFQKEFFAHVGDSLIQEGECYFQAGTHLLAFVHNIAAPPQKILELEQEDEETYKKLLNLLPLIQTLAQWTREHLAGDSYDPQLWKTVLERLFLDCANHGFKPHAPPKQCSRTKKRVTFPDGDAIVQIFMYSGETDVSTAG